VVETVEELEALPVYSMVLPEGFGVPVVRLLEGEPAGLEWYTIESSLGHTVHEIPLPARLLFVGGEG
jgi:hypothetical protein